MAMPKRVQDERTMIDNFSLALTHALLLFAAWRLFGRAELDSEDIADTPRQGWGRPRP